MANGQLKRILRRRPEVDEAELELLQSRVLARLQGSPANGTSAEDVADPEAEMELFVPVVGVMAEPDSDAWQEPVAVMAEPEVLAKAAVPTEPEPTVLPADPDGQSRTFYERYRPAEPAPEPIEAVAAPVELIEPEEIVEPEAVAAPEEIVEPEAVAEPEEIAEPQALVAVESEPEPIEAAVEPEEIVEPEDIVEPAAVVAAAPEPEPIEAVIELEEIAEPERIEEPAASVASNAPIDEPEIAAIATTPTPIPQRKPPPARKRSPAPRPTAPTPVATPAAVTAKAAAPAPYCPYCALLLDPPPETSRRCPRCRERIVVKRVEGRAVYLTEASLAIFDAERRRVANRGRWTKERGRWLKVAASVDAPPEKIARLEKAPLSDEVVASSRNLYLTTVDRSYRAARRDRRWEDASRIMRDHAMVLFKLAGSPIPPPEDSLDAHRLGALAALRGLGEMSRVVELVSGKCCDICQADDGALFKVAAELRQPRLPHAGCSKGLCRCDWYLAVRDQSLVRRQLRRRARTESAVRTTT